MKRRLLTLLLAISLLAALGLTGCGKERVEVTTPPSEAPQTATPAPPPEATKKPVADFTAVYKVPGNSVSTLVEVEVTFKDNAISDVKVLSSGETQRILDTVIERLIPRIIEAQSLGVDSITGATGSSGAVKSAIAKGIDENGGDSTEWFTPVEKKTDVVKLEGYDVIVVGLGGGGMTAYLAAAQGGATVFGIEACAKIGGNSATAGGPMTINPQTKMDSQNGGAKFLEEEDLIADWIDYTRGDAKADIIRLFVEQSGETVDWLANDYDFKFMDVKPFFHPKMWPTVANYATEELENDDGLDLNKTPMFTKAVDKAKALNEKNDYMLELTATELIVENDKIVGVKAEYYDGTTYEIYGDSVILATGGFIGNSEMKEQYFGSDYRTEAVLTEDGSGIQMALSVGAATYNISMPGAVHIAQVKNIIRTDELTGDQKAMLTALALKGDSLVVGKSGNRFANEAGMFSLAFDNWKDGSYMFAIYSQDLLDDIKANGIAVPYSQMFLNQGIVTEKVPVADLDKILEVGEQFGNVVRADTLEELAEKLGTPGLVETVAAYNSYAAGEPDPFGKAPEMIHAIGEGPYVAVLSAGYYYGTCGGLDINTNMQVLKEDGSAIENLYAVGQDSSGVLFSPQVAYVTYGGAAQGWTITSGRLAGENAASLYAG
jgi:succinate dehydrogenase/fumarate reductase flavoprotein subunit/uncharacterized protein with FMN-binding domain